MAEKTTSDGVAKDQHMDEKAEHIVSPVSPASPTSTAFPARDHASPVSAATTEPHRWSQYAENQSCPLPQLSVDPEGGAPELVTSIDQHHQQQQQQQQQQPQQQHAQAGYDGRGDEESASVSSARLPVVEPDIGDRRSATIVYAEPERSWVSKHMSYVIAALVLALIIVTGVTVGVMIHKHAGVDDTSTTPIPGPTTIPTSTARVTPSGGSSTPSATASACASPSTFVTSVSWMGIEGAAGGWKAAYSAASDAAACCSICHGSQPSGCDAWAWMPVEGSPGTACNMIVGYAGAKSDNDTTCPSGLTGVTFSTDSGDASHVGGAGPCATVAS